MYILSSNMIGNARPRSNFSPIMNIVRRLLQQEMDIQKLFADFLGTDWQWLICKSVIYKILYENSSWGNTSRWIQSAMGMNHFEMWMHICFKCNNPTIDRHYYSLFFITTRSHFSGKILIIRNIIKRIIIIYSLPYK